MDLNRLINDQYDAQIFEHIKNLNATLKPEKKLSSKYVIVFPKKKAIGKNQAVVIAYSVRNNEPVRIGEVILEVMYQAGKMVISKLDNKLVMEEISPDYEIYSGSLDNSDSEFLSFEQEVKGLGDAIISVLERITNPDFIKMISPNIPAPEVIRINQLTGYQSYTNGFGGTVRNSGEPFRTGSAPGAGGQRIQNSSDLGSPRNQGPAYKHTATVVSTKFGQMLVDQAESGELFNDPGKIIALFKEHEVFELTPYARVIGMESNLDTLEFMKYLASQIEPRKFEKTAHLLNYYADGIFGILRNEFEKTKTNRYEYNGKAFELKHHCPKYDSPIKLIEGRCESISTCAHKHVTEQNGLCHNQAVKLVRKP